MQALQEPPSRRHSNVEPPSLAVKEKLGSPELVGSFGCAVIVVFGGVVSIVNVRLDGLSLFAAASTARTRTT